MISPPPPPPEQSMTYTGHGKDRDDFVSRLIDDVQRGDHPLVNDLKPGELRPAYNPVTGNSFHGLNQLKLAGAGFDDPRWMTYVQARDQGCQVKRGESGVRILVWSERKSRVVRDPASGKAVLDDLGQPVREEVQFSRPFVGTAHLFNGSQIQGMPVLDKEPPREARFELVLDIIRKSGAVIDHDPARSTPIYLPAEDRIVMPEKNRFASEEAYLRTLFHQLGHWIGHESRRGRDLDHPVGSTEYAREQMVAQLFSFQANVEFNIGYRFTLDPTTMQQWVEILRSDPDELFRANAAANEAFEYAVGLSMDRNPVVVQETAPQASPGEAVEPGPVDMETEFERINLRVPYAQRQKFKTACIRNRIQFGWDKEGKTWYTVTSQAMVDRHLSQWKGGPKRALRVVDSMSWMDDCADALRKAGLIIDGPPVLDGHMQRVPVAGAKSGKKDGAYVGDLLGQPSCWFQNFVSGEKGSWHAARGAGQMLDREEVARLRQAQKEEREAEQADAIRRLRTLMPTLAGVGQGDHQYAQNKGILISDETDPALRLNERFDSLVIPLYNTGGELVSAQWIGPNGVKGIFKGTPKQGSFHVVGFHSTPEYAGSRPDRIFICEGWATAKSIADAMGQPVVMAVDAGNLQPVAGAFRESCPGAEIVIAADNDLKSKHGNKGLEFAKDAAKSVEGTVVFPRFHNPDSKGSDFNDLACEEDIDAVRTQISSVLEQERTRYEELEFAR